MQVDLLNYLLEADEVEAILASHSGSGKPLVNWIIRPDGQQGLPAITLFTASDVPQYDQEGRSGLQPSRVQFSIWGETYSSCRAVFEVVRDLLCPEGEFLQFTKGDTFFEKILLEQSGDGSADDLPGGKRVFHLPVDFIIWHRGA